MVISDVSGFMQPRSLTSITLAGPTEARLVEVEMLDYTSFQIPLVSGLIAFVASVLAVSLQSRHEIRKVRKELEQLYASKLFEKRVEAYPEMYYFLSDFNKQLLYGTHGQDALLKFRDSVDEWNSKNSIFFTSHTSKISSHMRIYLKELLGRNDDAFQQEDWELIGQVISAFRSSLRAEIGIYDTEPVGVAKDLDRIHKHLDEQIAKMQLVSNNPTES